MRILVAGAGAVGGYFGGRLAEKGEDVTFLLRPERKRTIDNRGLIINSVHGDAVIPVQTMSKDEAKGYFDLIIISSKAYQLNEMLDDVIPFVGPDTRILPLLNGYAHYDFLKNRIGADKVLGGLCFVESTLGPNGEVLQTSPQHRITFGSFTGNGPREKEIAEHLDGANFTLLLSEDIMREIWTKYIYISCLAGMTSLLRAPIGDIRDNEWGWQLYERLAAEVVNIASQAGFPVDDNSRVRLLELARNNHPALKSSMQRDMEKGLPVEADHLHGYLLQLARDQGSNPAQDYPILSMIYANLKIYENRK